MKHPHITVVIPTRERCLVLRKALATVTSQNYDRLSIIVSDNHSGDETRAVVEAAADRRIRYINTGQRLSMSHNWEFALSHVEDGWLTIMGDDDGLMPDSVESVADLIGDLGVQAIRSETCPYSWPSLTGEGFGRLRVPLRRGLEIRSTGKWLTKTLQGQVGYPQLPMLYNGGYVDFDLMKRLKAKTGAFYRSCIPDVYSAVSVSSLIDRYAYSHDPLAVNGASRYSTGTSYFSKDRTESSSPAQKFANEGNIPFHAALPLCADGSYPTSLQAIVYESYLQTMDLRQSNPHFDHAAQMATILATANKLRGPVQDWAVLFARQHSLDIGQTGSALSPRNLDRRIRWMVDRVTMGLDTYSLGSAKFQVRDVYEATIAAAAIRAVSPNRLRNLASLVGQIRNYHARDE